MSDDQNTKRGMKGVKIVIEHLRKKGFISEDVSTDGQGTNWDVKATHPETGHSLKIEVKSTKHDFAVPDLSYSQIEKNEETGFYKLKADELWIVAQIESNNPKIYKLTSGDILALGRQGGITEKKIWKISDAKAKKLKQPVDEEE